jgi:hypothetical protein
MTNLAHPLKTGAAAKKSGWRTSSVSTGSFEAQRLAQLPIVVNHFSKFARRDGFLLPRLPLR